MEARVEGYIVNTKSRYTLSIRLWAYIVRARKLFLDIQTRSVGEPAEGSLSSMGLLGLISNPVSILPRCFGGPAYRGLLAVPTPPVSARQ